MCLHIIFATWLVILYCPVQLCVLGQNNCPGQFLRCFIVSRRWATWQPSVALLHFLSRSPPSTNANTNFLGNLIFSFISFFLTLQQVLWLCDLLKYSSILCLAEVLWNLVGNFVWNIAAAHKTALIYSEIRSYIRILHLGYHWEPHFFWVNSWTMSNTDIVGSSLKSNSETRVPFHIKAWFEADFIGRKQPLSRHWSIFLH